MAYTKNQLIRMAFQQLGTSYNVTDIDTDNSQNGVYARDAWDAVVPKVFTKFFWNFAKQRQQLSQVILPLPPQPWMYLYQIPSEAIQIYTVYPYRTNYQIWGEYIACNLKPAWLDFQIITAVSSWNNTFAMYIMWLVAEFMAPVVSENAGITNRIEAQRKSAEADAQIYISQTQTNVPLLTAPFIEARYQTGIGSGYVGPY
jgi:hypothetical protein